MIRTILATKAFHFIATRFGPSRLRSLAFDHKYRRGDWCFRGDSHGDLPATVARYLRHGDLLVLGCGGASVLEGLAGTEFNSALGVDLSHEAITLANRHASPRVTFLVADMESFEPSLRYDEILFSESLYYVRASRRIQVLTNLGSHLKPGGVFVVTLSEPQRYRDIIASIRSRFPIIEDRLMTESQRHLLVFRPR